ncbi:SLC11A1 [Branchiostoma lanceolatum]|uniref:SLC11A1 protein n=1 Tax=Branchiostoma lanceolatum TaxID=7740 RepID=A0A8K0EAA4_BRALA|nr:SLC11A1 [Branchiostoma lanceolatum]
MTMADDRKPLVSNDDLSYSGQVCPPAADSSSSLQDVSEGGGDDDTTQVNFEIAPGQVHIPSTTSSGFSFRKLWAFTGPGWLMSIAYLDPGNIESDLTAGAVAKYKLLWVLMWSTVMGLILQLLAARLGCVTGLHLAQVCRQKYPRGPRLALWIMMEIAIIGSDIQEVVGSAIAMNLLSAGKIPIWAGVILTGADTFTFLFLENYGLRKLEGLFCSLITIMAFSFGYMYCTIRPDQGQILQGMWFPWCQNCNKEAIQQAVGIVGAIIMPHNIYLHSALVLSRDIDRKDKSKIKEANMYNAIESAIALFVSFLINLFVTATFAHAFSDSSKYQHPSLSAAGKWIFEKYGLAMKIIWGIGILAAGQSSTMTGTYAGQFVMEGFLDIHWAKWKRVLLTRSIAMGPTIVVALFAHRDLDMLNNWLNVLMSIQLPFALIPILHFTSSESIMGEFKNSRFTKILVWCLATVIIGVNFYLGFTYVDGVLPIWGYVLVGLAVLIYMIFVLYLAVGINNWNRLIERMRIWRSRQGIEVVTSGIN